MKTFLQEVSYSILKKTTDFKDTVIVLPNERACAYLKNHFKKELTVEVLFLPRIMTISSFIGEISGFEKIDPITLILEFYRIYLSENGSDKKDSFGKFTSWISIAIQDFNEIDSHLVDLEKLFSHLKEIQKIKDWSLSRDKITDTIQHYKNFMENLYSLYKKLRDFLLEKKMGYQGMIYRQAYENHKSYLKKHQKKSFYFIGFNALNKVEEEIFKSFLSVDKNCSYWDVDNFYMENDHNAGVFLRKYFNDWDSLKHQNKKRWIYNHFSKKKNIQIFSSSSNVTGIKTIASLLENEIDLENTAFVLAEESLLPIVLNSIPERVSKVNITMGYPLKNTSLSNLFRIIFKLHLNSEDFQKNAFSREDILSFFSHFHISKSIKKESEKVVKFIRGKNSTFLKQENLTHLFSEIGIDQAILKLFTEQKDVSQFLTGVFNFIDYLSGQLKGIDLICLARFKEIFQRLYTMHLEYGYTENVKILESIFDKLVHTETLDFKGKIEEGLQLMGMLETRCLDFKNVIITSLNEGILPKGSKERSFIPFEVKKEFGMPTFLSKDAIFSYHFFRLIQRAENIYLFYNMQSDHFGGSEMSRFLIHLLTDKKEEIIHRNIVVNSHQSEKKSIEIEKTPEIIHQLKTYFREKGISPSNLIEYINDPFEFYKKIVLKIKKYQNSEDGITSSIFGNIIHNTLKNLYYPLIFKKLEPDDIKNMKSKVRPTVFSEFKKCLETEDDIKTGKNKLLLEVAIRYVSLFLNEELSKVKNKKEMIVMELEKKYEISFKTSKDHRFIFRGYIDRIDNMEGVYRIIDYKTGKVNPYDLRLENSEKIISEYRYHKVFQLMSYALLYTNDRPFDFDSDQLNAGIFSFRNFKSGFLPVNFSDIEGRKDFRIVQHHLKKFEENLFSLVDEILNEDLPFIQNLDNPYKSR